MVFSFVIREIQAERQTDRPTETDTRSVIEFEQDSLSIR